MGNMLKDFKIVIVLGMFVLSILYIIFSSLWTWIQQDQDATAFDDIVKSIAALEGTPPTLAGPGSPLIQKVTGRETVFSSWNLPSSLGATWRKSTSGIHWTSTWDGTYRQVVLQGMKDSTCKALAQSFRPAPRLARFSIGANGDNPLTGAVNIEDVEPSVLAATVSDLADNSCDAGAGSNQIAVLLN
jgi:hypothetical protein